MADTLSPERRSANMRAIRSKGMKPELVVRKIVRSLGFGYRLHRKELPGKPDLVLIGKRKVIFVHGCYWHQHPNCREGRLPSSNLSYWAPKLARNVNRDAANLKALNAAGWKTLVIWECETKDLSAMRNRLERFMTE